MSHNNFLPKSDYDLSVYDDASFVDSLPASTQATLRSVRLDLDLYLLVDRWKSRLRIMHPGSRVTIRAIFNRGIYLVCKELEAKYGTFE